MIFHPFQFAVQIHIYLISKSTQWKIIALKLSQPLKEVWRKDLNQIASSFFPLIKYLFSFFSYSRNRKNGLGFTLQGSIFHKNCLCLKCCIFKSLCKFPSCSFFRNMPSSLNGIVKASVLTRNLFQRLIILWEKKLLLYCLLTFVLDLFCVGGSFCSCFFFFLIISFSYVTSWESQELFSLSNLAYLLNIFLLSEPYLVTLVCSRENRLNSFSCPLY